MKVLRDDPERHIYTLDGLDGYAHPSGDGYLAVSLGGGNWSIQAPTREELDQVLAHLLTLDIGKPVLSKRPDYDYEHKPTGLIVEREVEPWPSGRGNTVHWFVTIDGVRCSVWKVESFRNLLKALAERNQENR